MKDIKKLRKILGIKQFEMTEKLGMHQGTYCQVENGRLTPKTLENIRDRCLAILLPKFDKLIWDKNVEIGVLTAYRKSFNAAPVQQSSPVEEFVSAPDHKSHESVIRHFQDESAPRERDEHDSVFSRFN